VTTQNCIALRQPKTSRLYHFTMISSGWFPIFLLCSALAVGGFGAVLALVMVVADVRGQTGHGGVQQ